MLTSLGLLVLRKELHGCTLERRGHLVCVLELLSGPLPDLLHVVGHIVGDVGAVLSNLSSLLGL